MKATLAPESLSGAELASVAELWKRDRRRLATAFCGSSMLPAIASGQRVVVDCGKEPDIGDVIVYSCDGKPRVHRLVARGTTWLVTWGDSNPLPDIPVDASCVIGVIAGAPAAARAQRRGMLIRALGGPRAPIEAVARRIRFLYGVRNAWRRGFAFFVRKAVRTLMRKALLRVPRVGQR